MTTAFERKLVSDTQVHNEWQAEIDRRDDIIYSDKQIIADLRAEIEQTRTILAGTAIGSLPNDYPLSKMAIDMWNTLQERTLEGMSLIGRLEANDTAWLIETGDHKYWDGRKAHSNGFTDDPNCAVRFSRFEDSERVIHWLLSEYSVFLVSREHSWITTSSET